MHRIIFRTLVLSVLVAAVSPPPAVSASSAPPGKVRWDSVANRERQALQQYLTAADWPIRVFGLLRLERYTGEKVQQLVHDLIRDEAWQVRCFALRQALRMGYTITQADLRPDEDAAYVIRADLRHGIALDEAVIEPLATKLMQTKNVDELILGLEIAGASQIESVRTEAAKRTVTLIRNMNNTVAAVVSRRLAALLGLPRAPTDVQQWNAWLNGQEGKIEFPPLSAFSARAKLAPPSLVSEMSVDTFARLVDYLDTLRQRDLDLVIVMDATSSMIPMINEARVGVDGLILFLNDISKTMRLAFVAYRDHDNKPIWEGHRFTVEVVSIRNFLFNLRITGGADLPEAVLEGLTACGSLNWNPNATRQIILVGDARPHDEDVFKVLNLVESYRNDGLTVHAVHVPMEIAEQHKRFATPQRRAEVQHHNAMTAAAFQDIATHGGGRKVTLADPDQLVPSIMHTTLQEPWWPAFDEFYDLYLQLCR